MWFQCLLSRKPLAGERICTKGPTWSPRQSESELRVRRRDEISESPSFPPSSCHPCLPSPVPAQVQWRGLILLLQQQLSLLAQQEHQQQTNRCGREVFLRWRRRPLPDRQPGLGRWDSGVGSWRSGGGSAWTNYPRCSQRRPAAESGLLLWKEKEASQLWWKPDIRRSRRRRRAGD